MCDRLWLLVLLKKKSNFDLNFKCKEDLMRRFPFDTDESIIKHLFNVARDRRARSLKLEKEYKLIDARESLFETVHTYNELLREIEESSQRAPLSEEIIEIRRDAQEERDYLEKQLNIISEYIYNSGRTI